MLALEIAKVGLWIVLVLLVIGSLPVLRQLWIEAKESSHEQVLRMFGKPSDSSKVQLHAESLEIVLSTSTVAEAVERLIATLNQTGNVNR